MVTLYGGLSQKSFQDLRFPRTGASAPRVCLCRLGVSAPRLFLPKSVSGVKPNLGTSAPVRPLEDIPRSRDESTRKGTRSIDAAVDPNVRLASQPDCLPPCVFFRRRSGSGVYIYGDLFTRTIPPAGFTIDSHDTSLALLRSLECYHLTFITACRAVFV